MFFCAFSVMATTANSQKAKVSIKSQNVALVKVLNEIEHQTNYLFVYPKGVDVNRRVSVNANDATVEKVLHEIFNGDNISYKLEGNYIILTKGSDSNGSAEVRSVSSQQQNKVKISGKVVDERGEPLIGVSVKERGTSNGSITDMNGQFSLSVTPGATLHLSYVGFTPMAVKASSGMTVVMKEDTKALDEVVVVGYGSTTKRALISSVSTVKTEDMQGLPLVNITQGLAGRAPGLIVKANGGGINKNSTITIRGGDTPLVVIDGVIRDYSDFTTLANEDIASLSILKDASATAVYGSRAANGILQVTTKSGQLGKKPSIDYSFNMNFSQPAIWARPLSSYEMASQANKAAAENGKNLPYTDDILAKYRDHTDLLNYPDTDWRGLVLRSFAPTSKHNFSMSGGTEINKYFISVGYIDQQSLYKTNTHWMKRGNFRLSQSSTIKSIGLRTNVQLDGYIQTVQQPSSTNAPYNYGDPYYYVFSHLTNASPMTRTLNKYGLLLYGGNGDNALAETSEDAGYGKRKNTTLNGKVGFEWDVPHVSGLMLKATASYRTWMWHEKIWTKDPKRYDGETETPTKINEPKLSVQDNNGYDYTLQGFVTYDRTFGKHSVSALGGYECSYSFGNSLWGSRQNYVFTVDQLNSGASASQKNSGTEWEQGRAGWIGQLKYNYDNKYFFEGSMRYDGSDQFPKSKRWGTFYAASVGWSIADEAFMASLREKDIINTLKLRASYGEVGLDNWGSPYNIDRFAYLQTYGYNANQYVINGTMMPGLYQNALASNEITWFTSKQTDIGIDFASLGNRLSGSLDYFIYKTTGFLYSPDALKVGYTDPLGTSLPKVKTDGEQRRAGWEIQLNWRDKIGKVGYNVGFNFTYADKLWALNPAESLENKKNPYIRETQRKGAYGIMYHSLGFFKDNADIAASAKPIGSSNLAPGDLKYQDFNGDGIIDAQDRQYLGKNSFPRGIYGITLGAKYEGFSLDLLFQGSTRFDAYLGDSMMMTSSSAGYSPRYDFQLDYWTKNNTNARFPRLLSQPSDNGGNNQLTSDFWLINGAYFRMKDIRLTYDFKHSLLKKVTWITRCQAVVSGQNIFTISKMTKYGLDPENASMNSYSYPVERSFSFGFNIGF